MSKELDKLIEQALNERAVGISGISKTKNKKRYTKSGIRRADLDPDPVNNYRVVSKAKELAGLDGKDNSISTQDIEQGLADTDKKDYAAAWLDAIKGGTHSNKGSFIRIDFPLSQASRAKGLDRLNQGSANFGKVIYDYLKDGKVSEAKEVLDDFKTLVKKGAAGFKFIRPELIKSVDEAIAGVVPGQPVGDDVRKPLESLIKAANASIEREKREYTDIAGSLDVSTPQAEVPGLSSTATSFGTKVPEIDSALKSQFDVFDLTRGVTGIFQQMADVANTIKNGNFPTDQKDAFEFVIKANVVTRVANLSKMYDYSSAGFEFEKILALILGGAKVGGDSGAADVLAKLNGGDAIHTSQKLVTEDHSFQSLANTIELLKKGKKLYYTFLRKTGGTSGDPKTGYDGIDVYISTIYTTNPSDPQVGNIFIADALPGVSFDTAGRKVPEGTGSNAGKIKIKPSEKFGTIPVFDTNLPQEVAKYVSDSITGGAQTPFKQMAATIIDSFRALKNMERNTQEYNAKRVKKDAGNPNLQATDYVKEIAQDYVDLKDNYQKIFLSTEKTSSTIGGKQVFTESKSPIDQLIESIIKEKLFK